MSAQGITVRGVASLPGSERGIHRARGESRRGYLAATPANRGDERSGTKRGLELGHAVEGSPRHRQEGTHP